MKKKICFAGFAESELPELRAATATSNPLWESHFVADAPAALALLTGQKFDALVANMSMPGKNGAELLREARETCPNTLGFIVGEVTDQAIIINCIGGTHQFIRRPFQPEKLVASLKRGLKLDNWLSSDDLRKLAPRLRRLPSLPSTYFNLLKEVECASATTQGIGSVIARDPVATGRLLHMCNSAAFSLVQKVTDPVHAVALLGIETVKSLVMSLQIFSQTDMARGSGLSLEILWEHSLLVAKFARQITLKQTGDPKLAGEAFTAGLLHDVGRIVLASNLPKEYAAIIASAREGARPLHEEETAQLRVNHAEIGAYLLGLWGLPAEIVEATAGHHAPGQTVYASEFSLLGAVHAANVFAHETGGQTDGLCLPELDLHYFEMVKLDDQLAIWKEVCTGEQTPAPDKMTMSGAPAPAKARSVVLPADKAKNVVPPPVNKTTSAAPAPAKAGGAVPPAGQAKSAAPPPVPWVKAPPPRVTAKKALPPPLPPGLLPDNRFLYAGIAAMALFLIIGGMTAWHFHGQPAPAPEAGTVPAPSNEAVTVQPLPAAPAVAAVNTQPAPGKKIQGAAAGGPTKPPGPFDKIRVQGIFYRSASPLAIINGKTVGIGDSINGVQVAGINEHSVTVELNGEQKVFKFN